MVEATEFDRLLLSLSFNGDVNMMSLIRVRSLLVAGLVAGCLTLSGNANATDCHTPKYIVKTVTVYVDVEQSYTAHVTRYDHCGTPYQVRVTRHKTVSVPVVKQVRVYL